MKRLPAGALPRCIHGGLSGAQRPTEVAVAKTVSEEGGDPPLRFDLLFADRGHGLVDSEPRISQRPFLVGPT